MNIINKQPLNALGYNFIEAKYLPEGKNEYYLRDVQNRSGIAYRHLVAYEIEVLVRNRNTSDNWNNIFVSDAFNPELVKNCKFYGLVRVGKLEPYYLEFHNLKAAVGLYNSTIISCDLGDNVVVDNINYLSHYIIGNDVILVNINELACTDKTKFGNGIIKDGETEAIRIKLEVCNENGGRSIIPFNNMLPGDAYLWSRYRNDEKLQQQFANFVDNQFDKKRGYYGKIGDRSVIKNCRIIKDCWIGSDAYIKGANKLKNLTINSTPDAKTQIGEGCEMVNGIIGIGCRIFYGVKAVRFVMASHSQLKYGARLINSYLGNNATISCCEVLNSLIFPAHEQHHNNSFLCASLIMGQSNIAAGATIGSNHNSRSADGEIIAGRGFWPGLCVSLKHNSKFASFNMLTRGDYPAELNVKFPFALISNDTSKNELVVMPAYWFKYNMYALARNAGKYVSRDNRIDKIQLLEYDYLAPDSINEIIEALRLLKLFTGRAYIKQSDAIDKSEAACIISGEQLLNNKSVLIDELEIVAENFENTSRKVKLVKVQYAYDTFKELINYYLAQQLADALKTKTLAEIIKLIAAKNSITAWENVGGQFIPIQELNKLLLQIKEHKLHTWLDVHAFYKTQAALYPQQKLLHAIAAYENVFEVSLKKKLHLLATGILKTAITTRIWMMQNIYDSRAKDYNNEFRKMVYHGAEEMNAVTGSLADNGFILQEQEALKKFRQTINALIKKLNVAE
jgi:Domain of unknown function (DUF4954)